MANILEILAKNVRSHREEIELSQLKLAYQLEISPSYFVGIETGKQNPSIKVIEKIANFFGVEVYELLMSPETKKIVVPETQAVLKNLQAEINQLFEMFMESDMAG